MIDNLTYVSTGLCASCSQCQSDFNFEISIDDCTYHEWFERDRAHIELRIGDHAIIEYWDDDLRQAIEDGFLDASDYRHSLWELAEYYDLIDNIPQNEIDSAFENQISNGDIFDEGSISSSGCDCCGDCLQQKLYVAHGRDENNDIIHFDVCEDCLIEISG